MTGSATSINLAGLPELASAMAAVWLVVLGLVIGSFLNVVISRVPEGLSIVRPGSRCPRCGHTLSWWENIPVLSWALLGGKCRQCRLPISLQYPAVELLTGALFLGCLVRFGWTWDLVRALTLVVLVVPLSVIDLQHWILPFSLTLPGIACGLLLAVPLGWTELRDATIGAGAAFFGFWAMEWIGERIFKKEALGGGDKYLLAMLGAFLTWRGLLGVVFLASLQGSIVGLTLLGIYGRAGPAAEEPDAPATPAVPEPAPEPVPEPALKEPEPAPDGEEEDDWVPGPTNMPFGPWLSIAGLELMLLGPWLVDHLPWPISWLVPG